MDRQLRALQALGQAVAALQVVQAASWQLPLSVRARTDALTRYSGLGRTRYGPGSVPVPLPRAACTHSIVNSGGAPHVCFHSEMK